MNLKNCCCKDIISGCEISNVPISREKADRRLSSSIGIISSSIFFNCVKNVKGSRFKFILDKLKFIPFHYAKVAVDE